MAISLPIKSYSDAQEKLQMAIVWCQDPWKS